MINQTEAVITGKFLSLFLRHKPQIIELTLDEHGWASVNKLVDQMNKNGFTISQEVLDYVVTGNETTRFAYNDDRTKIRASQLQSAEPDLDYTPRNPPALLYHGTGKPSVPSILSKGLDRKTRLHVHLSHDREMALQAAQSQGEPYVFAIAAAEMYQAGFSFYLSENQVWLTHHVPTQYLQLLENE